MQGTVTYDGLEAKIHWVHTAPADASWASKTAMAAAPPTLVFNYADNNSIGSYFDIHPATAASSGKGSEDKFLRVSDPTGGSNDISFVGDAAAAQAVDLCTEKWYLSPTAIACVEMAGSLTRKRNTGDYLDDINLDYTSAYQVSAQIGQLKDTDEQFKFPAQTVDFKTFFTSGALDISSSLAIVSALAYTCVF